MKQFQSEQVTVYISLGGTLKKDGIVHTFGTSYALQYNGLAERYNRTLLSKTRALIFDSGPESIFWMRLHFTQAIPNVVSFSAHNGRTLYEELFSKYPDVPKIRIFGCQPYVHYLK